MDTCRNFKQSLRQNSAFIYVYIWLWLSVAEDRVVSWLKMLYVLCRRSSLNHPKIHSLYILHTYLPNNNHHKHPNPMPPKQPKNAIVAPRGNSNYEQADKTPLRVKENGTYPLRIISNYKSIPFLRYPNFMN